MKKSKSNRRHILARYGVIIAAILLLSITICAKLVDTTILSADKWNEKAMRELSKVETIVPQRGDILANDGSLLATNLKYYTVRMDYRSERFMEDRLRLAIDSIADSLALHFPVRSAKEWKDHLLKPLDKPKGERPRAHKILGNISYADYLLLRTFPFFKIKNSNRNGVVVESRIRRVNPYGDMARRSIGGVGATSENPETHGISGLEKALDNLLYGRPGLAKKVPLTRGIVNWTDVPAQDGYDIRTTIDIKMQDIVENELNDVLTYCDADWGVAVLMEVATGDIKAISNLEKSKTSRQYIEGMNRAVLGYEPGSVIKTLSMMIALEEGIVSNVDQVWSTGSSWAYAGGRAITDAHGVSALTVSQVIEMSSNIGMSKIITSRYDKHPGEFYSKIKSLGFLEPMHTGIAGETVPRIDSVPDNRGGRITLSRQCYGYATEVPPLYTLSIYNAIANNGRYVRPRLVKELLSDHGDSLLPVTYIRERACSEANAKKLQKMLTNVVWGEHGTGRRLRNDYVRIAGKTGTCYMLEGGSYNTSKKRLAFCGFFPAEEPLYSCIVLVCHPRQNALGAASTSGEVLKNIALKLYSRGMLNNSSDYREVSESNTFPTLYATPHAGTNERIRRHLEIDAERHALSSPRKVERGVPDVVGYGLRDAIATLENAGYNVEFRGAGYVCAQSPRAGSIAATGDMVTLKLTE